MRPIDPRVGMYFASFTEGNEFAWSINKVTDVAGNGTTITALDQDSGDGEPYDWHLTVKDWMAWQRAGLIVILPNTPLPWTKS